ncbi:MAG: hypothetical protein ACFFDQ_12095 [Candidatus Thorarchaeota archaeon]
MKILYVSDGGLPDSRVERMALIMKDEGHEIVLIGGNKIRGQHLSAFSETTMIPLGNGFWIVYDPRVKKK